jgi:two-component system phosphate regulon sensor histidine kinase PhoR
MISPKNLSPGQLSAMTAALLAIPIAIGFGWISGNALNGWISLAVIFIGSYALIFFTLDRFIYRKVKLIYKLIHQTKASKREDFYNKYILPKKSIDEVREDVEEWAGKQQQEIELLKKNEAYRKEFLQNLAHELKTPIFSVQGYLDNLLSGALEDEAVNRKFLEKAARNTDRLVHLVKDLDEISKLESGELMLYKQNFIIQDLLHEIFDELSMKMQLKKIHAGIKKGCESPVMVFADREKIKQVLINIVVNAIKYGKTDGNIIASIYRTDEKRVLVEISDDGIGIEEEHLTRIFERFYRTDTARSRDKGGSGLGLAISKHIIEAHGQTIHVRSRIDVGTTIGFTLEYKRD